MKNFITLLVGTASAADNSQYMAFPGWTDPKPFTFPKGNSTYKMVKTGADCAAYPEKDRKAAGWVYVEPTGSHDYTIIHLHGTGGVAKMYPGLDEF